VEIHYFEVAIRLIDGDNERLIFSQHDLYYKIGYVTLEADAF